MDIRQVGNQGMQLSNPRAKTAPAVKEQAAGVEDSFTVSGKEKNFLKTCLTNMVQNKSKILPGVKTKQFADSHGRVKHLALMLSSYASGRIRSQMLKSYGTLFTKMEPDTKFTVVVATDRDKRDVQQVIKDVDAPNPERIKFIKPPTSDLTVWARDMMVPMFIPGDDEHTALLEQAPFHNWHGSDSLVPAEITKANPEIILDRDPRLITDGGEVMANTKESFIGHYSIAATAKKLADTTKSDPGLKQEVVKYYENTFDKQVVQTKSGQVFPYKFIPAKIPSNLHKHKFEMVQNKDYHAPKLKDGQVTEATMYEDLAVKMFEDQFGKPVNVMGADLPETAHKEEPATDHLDMGLTPVDDNTFFLGDPRMVDKIFKSMNSEELQQAEERLSEMAGYPVNIGAMVSRNRDNPLDFDGYEKTLKEKGYDVHRLPHSEPKWYGPYISYNNCLMERFEKDGQEVRRVFLPVYGIDKLDDYAVKQYEKQGFEVHPMPLDALSARWGALRCTSNWLDRSPRA
ncbi:MAG: hypothetical protein ACLFQV_08800 [Vulcanimicrobiota bacterium]